MEAKGSTMETYYDPAGLANFSADGVGSLSPELWDKYMNYYGAVFQDGALTAREKALIALAVAAAVQMPVFDQFPVTVTSSEMLTSAAFAKEMSFTAVKSSCPLW